MDTQNLSAPFSREAKALMIAAFSAFGRLRAKGSDVFKILDSRFSTTTTRPRIARLVFWSGSEICINLIEL